MALKSFLFSLKWIQLQKNETICKVYKIQISLVYVHTLNVNTICRYNVIRTIVLVYPLEISQTQGLFVVNRYYI